MEFEDLRSYAWALFAQAEGNQRDRDQALLALASETEAREKLNAEQVELTKNFEELTSRFGETCDQLSSALARNTELGLSQAEQERQIDRQNIEIERLREKEAEADSL
jgi:chromosome segregation ATPase